MGDPIHMSFPVTFDIDRFLEKSGRVDLSDIDWDDVPKHRLTPEALRAVKYFMVTESATFYYLKALMSTKTAQTVPEFAPFLCAWAYEEEFHGRAFATFIRAYGETVPSAYRGSMYTGRTLGERFDELSAAAVSFLAPDDFPATHMVWGALQELTTYTAYRALMNRTDHPILRLICERIMKQELKHFSFYFQQARYRLHRSRLAQKIARFALNVAWTPVGDGMSTKEEVSHALSFLFDGSDGVDIPQIEARFQALPGLETWRGFSEYVDSNGIRRAPREWFHNSFDEEAARDTSAPQIVSASA
jgi:hypothetical protein